MIPQTIVRVVWHDAHGGEMTGWGDPATVETGPHQIVTVGHLLDETPDGVTVALSFDETAETIDAYMFIPHGCIVSQVDLVAK